jgi:hypothetical protein
VLRALFRETFHSIYPRFPGCETVGVVLKSTGEFSVWFATDAVLARDLRRGGDGTHLLHYGQAIWPDLVFRNLAASYA